MECQHLKEELDALVIDVYPQEGVRIKTRWQCRRVMYGRRCDVYLTHLPLLFFPNSSPETARLPQVSLDKVEAQIREIHFNGRFGGKDCVSWTDFRREPVAYGVREAPMRVTGCLY